MENILRSGEFTAKASPSGAELVSFKKGDTEYIWQADPDIWARHAPVLFPFVCSTDSKKYTVNGKEFGMSNHGFARDSVFEVSASSESSVTYKLVSDKKTKELYPFDFEFCVKYSLEGNRLTTVFAAKNTGSEKMYFFLGGHPGFNCPLSEGETFEDYYVKYEKPEKIVREVNGKKTVIADDCDTVPLSREIFADDVFMKDNPDSSYIELKSRKSSRGVKLSFDKSGCIAVWSPYKENASFVCLEPWTSVPVYCDGTEELTEMVHAVKLAPSEMYRFEFTIEIF